MTHDRKNIIINLKKARGSLESILTQTENDEYCADIAPQINAVIGLLQSANRELLRDHLACCGVDALSSGDTHRKTVFIDELVRAWDIATRK